MAKTENKEAASRVRGKGSMGAREPTDEAKTEDRSAALYSTCSFLVIFVVFWNIFVVRN
jgi:hypothetical protein